MRRKDLWVTLQIHQRWGAALAADMETFHLHIFGAEFVEGSPLYCFCLHMCLSGVHKDFFCEGVFRSEEQSVGNENSFSAPPEFISTIVFFFLAACSIKPPIRKKAPTSKPVFNPPTKRILDKNYKQTAHSASAFLTPLDFQTFIMKLLSL